MQCIASSINHPDYDINAYPHYSMSKGIVAGTEVYYYVATQYTIVDSTYLSAGKWKVLFNYGAYTVYTSPNAQTWQSVVAGTSSKYETPYDATKDMTVIEEVL